MRICELNLLGNVFEGSFEDIPMGDDGELLSRQYGRYIHDVKMCKARFVKLIAPFLGSTVFPSYNAPRGLIPNQYVDLLEETPEKDLPKENRIDYDYYVMKTQPELIKQLRVVMARIGRDEDKLKGARQKYLFHKSGKAPFQISTGKSKFANPYYDDDASDESRYMGAPQNYRHWTATQTAIYNSITNAFKRLGIAPLTVMYGSKHEGIYRNFVIIGANGRFVWRKYDRGGGSGQNWVFIDGEKLHTSDLASSHTTTGQQDAILNPLKKK